MVAAFCVGSVAAYLEQDSTPRVVPLLVFPIATAVGLGELVIRRSLLSLWLLASFLFVSGVGNIFTEPSTLRTAVGVMDVVLACGLLLVGYPRRNRPRHEVRGEQGDDPGEDELGLCR